MITSPETHYAKVNEWLYVGDMLSCELHCATIHIYRSDFQEYCTRHTRHGSVSIDYKDGDEITPQHFEVIDGFIELTPTTPILVHCHAGACRSPIIAAYLLSRFDGTNIFDAIAMVSRAIWEQRGLAVNITHNPLKSILHHFSK